MTREPSWEVVGNALANDIHLDVRLERLEVERENAAQVERAQRGREARPMDPARTDPAAESMVLRGSRPRRRRWKDLDRFDDQLDKLTQRHGEALARIAGAEAALAAAPADDARRYAEWLAGGEKGEKPGSSLQDRTVERDGCVAFAAGLRLEIDRLLERRVEHVERNREKMLEDARKDVDPRGNATTVRQQPFSLWVSRSSRRAKCCAGQPSSPNPSSPSGFLRASVSASQRSRARRSARTRGSSSRACWRSSGTRRRSLTPSDLR
jgi:hypothetical protein